MVRNKINMVDELTRYYIRKQNLKMSDEFHERVIPSDIDELNNATIYMVMAPVVASALMYGYKKLKESGGAASHFAHAIRRAKSRFTPVSLEQTGGKWRSKGS